MTARVTQREPPFDVIEASYNSSIAALTADGLPEPGSSTAATFRNDPRWPSLVAALRTPQPFASDNAALRTSKPAAPPRQLPAHYQLAQPSAASRPISACDRV
jgi:hypothetical protein